MAVSTLMVMYLIFLFLFHTVSSAVDSIRPSQSMSDGETLVSKEGSFELGFFTPGNNTNRYVGIWYKNIPVQTVVWVANICDPINDSSGLLMINNVGNLVLMHHNNSSAVWSTSSPKLVQKPVVELLDSGNLVLRDEADKSLDTYLWQSFDHPSHTLLPDMKLGWDLRTGLKRRLVAWKNWDDPCPGDVSYGIEFRPQAHTFPDAYIRKGSTKFYRTGSWTGIRFSGSAELRSNPFYDFGFVYNDDEVYYIYHLKNKSLITRMTMNQTSAHISLWTWIEAEKTWKLENTAPQDSCDNYGLCGANSNCIKSQKPLCGCLDGYKPRSLEKWNSADWSAGCVENNTPSCKDKAKDVFVRFTGLKLPDASRSWMAGNLNLEDCRSICLNNCSCTAYANSDNRGNGSGCVTWYGDLIDIRTVPNNEEHIFIRMSHSDLGKDRHTMTRMIVAAPIIGGVSLMLILGYCICSRVLKGRKSEATRKNGAKVDDFELPLYSLAAISTATDNFLVNNKIGEGGFGSVYRGRLEDGQEIAVKRLSLSSHQGINEFKNEAILIAKLQHRNLVKLLGCCIEREENLLIYEYMPNKSLDILIFDQQQNKLIEWQKRFEIISGIARGLQYLHQDSRLRIVHRDLKASNILLDHMMNPKISDFGIAKSFGGDQIEGNTNRIAGTYGYMAPEYAFNGLFSTKSDVFSFGIMVLEIVSGKRSIRFHEKIHNLTLIGHAWTLLNQGCPLELIDARLRNSYDNLQQVMRCIHIGLLCVQQHPGDRPNMSSVVLMLSGESDLPPPKPPGYFTETDSHETDCMSTKPESPSKITMTVTAFGGR